MNKIKGLITKDLLQLKSYKKTLITFIFVFILVTFLDKSADGIEATIILMMILGLGMFSIATFNYDEMAKSDRYILTLPVTRKDIVLSKYILVFVSTIIGAILGVVLSILFVYITKKDILNIMYLIDLALGGIFGLGAFEAVQIPCIFKYGAERGRIQRFIVIFAIAIIFGGALYIIEKLNIDFETESLINKFVDFLPLVFVFLTFIMYYISYRISYIIYRKKEL